MPWDNVERYLHSMETSDMTKNLPSELNTVVERAFLNMPWSNVQGQLQSLETSEMSEQTQIEVQFFRASFKQ